MKNVLAPKHAKVLSAFAWSNLLIVLDFDGTLAPIVTHRSEARMAASTRRLVRALSARYPVAVVSGRARRDVTERLAGTDVHLVVGNHGLEPGVDAGRCREIVAGWTPVLRRRLEGSAGVEIEDKGLSVAVHYRRARPQAAAEDAIASAVRRLRPRPRWIGGKRVVNLVPEGAPHQGVCVLRLREHFGADAVLFVGDDEIDEDVFAIDDPGRLLGIRVGPDARSHAVYHVPTQRSVDVLLSRLVALRSAARARGGAA